MQPLLLPTYSLQINSAPGPALNASVIDMGDRFRMLVNEMIAVAAVKERIAME